jgi:hypothetical protein
MTLREVVTARSIPDVAPGALPPWWSIASSPSQLRPLLPDQCRQLLPEAGGAWLSYPQQPHRARTGVHYRRSEELLLLSAVAVLALAAAPLVVLRVDHLDRDRGCGWSIVAAGALRVHPPGPAVDLQPARGPALALDLAHLAGRQISV